MPATNATLSDLPRSLNDGALDTVPAGPRAGLAREDFFQWGFNQHADPDGLQAARIALQNFIEGGHRELNFAQVSANCIDGMDPGVLARALAEDSRDHVLPEMIVFGQRPAQLNEWQRAFPQANFFENYRRIEPERVASASPQQYDPQRFEGSSKLSQKDIAAQKNQGLFRWDTTHLQKAALAGAASIAAPTMTKPAATSDADMRQVIARFSDLTKRLGFNTYLSGGAVLSNFHGGSRPTADLDFRLRKAEGGIGNFLAPQGQALIRALNDSIRSLNQESGVQHSELFESIGKGGQTIGTNSFLGVETSISIVEHPQSMEVKAVDVTHAKDPHAVNVNTLTLKEFQYDKLKTMLSRLKWGETNIKKTAQDLFDLMEAMVIARPAGGQSLAAYARQSVEEAVNARTNEFRRSNPLGGTLLTASDSEIQKKMFALFVEMVKAHKTHPRAAELRTLIANLNEANGGSTRGTEIQNLFEALCQLESDKGERNFARGYVSKWGARQGPPNSTASTARVDTSGGMNSVEKIAWAVPLDARAVGAKLNLGLTDQALEHAVLVLKVLIHENGFRPLDDWKNAYQTQLAFGLSPNQFSKVYTKLKDKGLVVGQAEGLRLTPHGVQQLRHLGYRLEG